MRRIESVFEPRRFMQLLKLSYYGYARGFMLAGLLVGALYLMGGLLTGSMGSPVGHGAFINIAFMAGILLTANVFKELHHPEKGAYLLMLPGSQEEKFLVAFGVSALVYPAYAVVVMMFVSYLTGALNAMMYGMPFAAFDPFASGLGSAFGKYVAIHALFFAGSVWFRRYALFKTLFVVWLFSILVIPVFIGTYKIFVVGDLQSFLQLLGTTGDATIGGAHPEANPVYPYLKPVYGIIIPALLYCASYFRLREIEMKG